MPQKLSVRTTASVFIAALLIFAISAAAGPPLICHGFDIGSAKSLPWVSHGWNLDGSEKYDTSRLAADTRAILASDSSVIVHMETLRRATLYARKDTRAAKQLFDALVVSTKSSPTDTKSAALAYFDAGYLAEAYKQWIPEKENNPAAGIDGYSLIKQAIRLCGSDPQMEFAAALVSLSGPADEHREFTQKAMAGSKSDPLLAKNLNTPLSPGSRETFAEMLTNTTVAQGAKP